MKRALALAEKGRGQVSPNPLVGAIIVKEGSIVAEGYHEKYGEAHAEINALRQAGDEAAGATMYVNLEPCSHQGKTGPCTEALVRAGIARVVIAMRDPNPLVNGMGVTFLRSKGITVHEGVLEQKSRELNRGFIQVQSTGRPYLSLKIAQTLDGRIATSTGHSKWITAEPSRKMAHKIRATHDAILVGIGTLLTDDPRLTVRYSRGTSPHRIVLDSQLRVPLDAKVLSAGLAPNTLLITTDAASKEKITRIEERGASVKILPRDDRGWAALPAVWEFLVQRGVTSILIEGGSTVQTECIKGGFANRLYLFIAPKILGSGIDAIGDLGIRNINSALQLVNVSIRRLDEDFLIRADFSF
ncbi:bifunctional diaminohydroxyphosphoribosylaminopyrimidine deaminase/5-amino-6-(5-phosphoribosylamino)uracil reductase RibD [candidate division KSB1 bacterium]|nr:bifunctional diaminohydroxyphosphoribosylaminopyrimidine deaminase/5-amino-6-(5-phosphoribosylamino)uracil reductase RibD [candidate division KSB1 bacterium]